MEKTIVEARFTSMKGAADFIGPGSLETPKYDDVIFDQVRREFPIWNRIQKKEATGHPTRYFEQTAIAQGSFTNPRQINAARVAPTRVERFAAIKAISAQTTYSQFDADINASQGGFASLQSQDLLDMVAGVILVAALAVWNGTDTSLNLPTTTQYVGGLTQITLTATIAQGASIEDAIKAQLAAMVGNQVYNVRPTAIYASPQALDLLDQELKAARRLVNEVEITAGVKVMAIMTQAGLIPLVPDPGINATVVGGTTRYPIVIVTESATEFRYVKSPIPRVFELGLLANLAQQRVAVLFGAPIFRGPTYAHCVMTLIR
jgi:hypothetical protein